MVCPERRDMHAGAGVHQAQGLLQAAVDVGQRRLGFGVGGRALLQAGRGCSDRLLGARLPSVSTHQCGETSGFFLLLALGVRQVAATEQHQVGILAGYQPGRARVVGLEDRAARRARRHARHVVIVRVVLHRAGRGVTLGAFLALDVGGVMQPFQGVDVL